jgi:hypothetical protein
VGATVCEKEQGQFIETFDCTETRLVSIKVYKTLMQQEMIRCCKMKNQGWKDFNGANLYMERYKTNWETHLIAHHAKE